MASAWLEKAERCLEAARMLLAAGDADAACNRAYYAMFNASRAALVAVGQDQRSKSKTHAGLISAFGQFVVNAGHLPPELARALGKESNRRLVADYECEELTLENALDSVGNATAFVDAITQWISTRSALPPQ